MLNASGSIRSERVRYVTNHERAVKCFKYSPTQDHVSAC
jgi:hypothetical protein